MGSEKNSGIYSFLCISWVLITVVLRNINISRGKSSTALPGYFCFYDTRYRVVPGYLVGVYFPFILRTHFSSLEMLRNCMHACMLLFYFVVLMCCWFAFFGDLPALLIGRASKTHDARMCLFRGVYF